MSSIDIISLQKLEKPHKSGRSTFFLKKREIKGWIFPLVQKVPQI
jgi:hypothetical protein